MTRTHASRIFLLVFGALILIATSPAEGFREEQSVELTGGDQITLTLSGLNEPEHVESSITLATAPDAGSEADLMLIDPRTSEPTIRISNWVGLCGSGSNCTVEVQTTGTETGRVQVLVSAPNQTGCEGRTQPIDSIGALGVRVDP